MRRGFPYIVALALLGCSGSSLLAQYPYMPMPGYGYPQPMMRPPGYMPNPMMARPMYYYPQPRPDYSGAAPGYAQNWQGQPRVYNFGPVLEGKPAATTVNTPNPNSRPTPVSGSYRSLPSPEIMYESAPPGSCGPDGCCPPGGCPPEGCYDGSCGPCCIKPLPPPPHPHGHFIGYVGVYALVPYPRDNFAFSRTVTANGVANTTTADFSDQILLGPRASLGYVFHNGFGVRANYFSLLGSTSTNTTNNDTTGATVITSAGILPFQITRPSATLLGGVGVDQLSFRRSFEFQVADLELVYEHSIFDIFLTTSFGARYAYINQRYNASRSNFGGAGPVTIDVANLELRSRFNGIGPTLCFELVHPIKGSCFAFYGDARGSALFGAESFHRNLDTARVNVVPVSMSNVTSSNRVASQGELELGMQYAKRCGHCLLYGRAAAVYQRWWNVGSPTGTTGDIGLLGGTATIGIVY